MNNPDRPSSVLPLTVPTAAYPPGCFALLDDCDASAGDPRSRLYTGFLRMLRAHDAASLGLMLEQMEQALAQGLHAVGLFNYELGARMQGIDAGDCTEPAAQVLLFARCERMSAQQVGQWLAQHDEPDAAAGIADIRSTVDEHGFADALARIRAYIEAGDTYQINYTCRLRFDAYGTPLALYRRLRARQPVPYGALIALPDGGSVLSLSPELFIRHAQGRLTARPMKGTAAASGDAQADLRAAEALAADSKNRAENLMIVDLLRNDLGRVARLGSVRVPRLFCVERYSAVLQMTSTVEAELRADAGLGDIFGALYPCGSITGAPKRRAMQIIDEVEADARGIYTGAIGWFDAPGQPSAPGDFCLSVPIRTLRLQPSRQGLRRGELGVGAGIVYDSDATQEAEECRLKARFLTGLPHDFALFETMYATRAGCRHLELHLQRLRSSAAYFGFRYEEQVLRARLRQACDTFASDAPHRLRLALEQDGNCMLQSAPLTELALPQRVFVAEQPRRADDLFLRHKTTHRAGYDAAWREAEARGGFDMLFFNERGELTEGGRSNVFIRIDGGWCTPPLECGLLPGVMRAVLLADPNWNARERRLTRADLLRADEIVICNALRGALNVQLGRD